MSRQRVKVRYAIICDDVRREENGKLILIGVYSNNLLVPQLPTSIRLSVVLAIETNGPEQFDIELRLKLGQKIVRRAQGSVTVSASGITFLPLTGMVIRDLSGPGTLSVQAKVSQNRWETVCSVALDQKQD